MTGGSKMDRPAWKYSYNKKLAAAAYRNL